MTVDDARSATGEGQGDRWEMDSAKMRDEAEYVQDLTEGGWEPFALEDGRMYFKRLVPAASDDEQGTEGEGLPWPEAAHVSEEAGTMGPLVDDVPSDNVGCAVDRIVELYPERVVAALEEQGHKVIGAQAADIMGTWLTGWEIVTEKGGGPTKSIRAWSEYLAGSANAPRPAEQCASEPGDEKAEDTDAPTGDNLS